MKDPEIEEWLDRVQGFANSTPQVAAGVGKTLRGLFAELEVFKSRGPLHRLKHGSQLHQRLEDVAGTHKRAVELARDANALYGALKPLAATADRHKAPALADVVETVLREVADAVSVVPYATDVKTRKAQLDKVEMSRGGLEKWAQLLQRCSTLRPQLQDTARQRRLDGIYKYLQERADPADLDVVELDLAEVGGGEASAGSREHVSQVLYEVRQIATALEYESPDDKAAAERYRQDARKLSSQLEPDAAGNSAIVVEDLKHASESLRDEASRRLIALRQKGFDELRRQFDRLTNWGYLPSSNARNAISRFEVSPIARDRWRSRWNALRAEIQADVQRQSATVDPKLQDAITELAQRFLALKDHFPLSQSQDSQRVTWENELRGPVDRADSLTTSDRLVDAEKTYEDLHAEAEAASERLTARCESENERRRDTNELCEYLESVGLLTDSHELQPVGIGSLPVGYEQVAQRLTRAIGETDSLRSAARGAIEGSIDQYMNKIERYNELFAQIPYATAISAEPLTLDGSDWLEVYRRLEVASSVAEEWAADTLDGLSRRLLEFQANWHRFDWSALSPVDRGMAERHANDLNRYERDEPIVEQLERRAKLLVRSIDIASQLDRQMAETHDKKRELIGRLNLIKKRQLPDAIAAAVHQIDGAVQGVPTLSRSWQPFVAQLDRADAQLKAVEQMFANGTR